MVALDHPLGLGKEKHARTLSPQAHNQSVLPSCWTFTLCAHHIYGQFDSHSLYLVLYRGKTGSGSKGSRSLGYITSSAALTEEQGGHKSSIYIASVVRQSL